MGIVILKAFDKPIEFLEHEDNLTLEEIQDFLQKFKKPHIQNLEGQRIEQAFTEEKDMMVILSKDLMGDDNEEYQIFRNFAD